MCQDGSGSGRGRVPSLIAARCWCSSSVLPTVDLPSSKSWQQENVVVINNKERNNHEKHTSWPRQCNWHHPGLVMPPSISGSASRGPLSPVFIVVVAFLRSWW